MHRKKGDESLKKILDFLGIKKHRQKTIEYFDNSNLKASRYMACVMLLLELYTIVSVTSFLISGSVKRSTGWKIQHFGAYGILIVSALLTLIYSVLYFTGKFKNRKLGVFTIYYFCLVCTVFGIFISYKDYLKGEQILTFLTMEVFVTCIYVWKPYISFLYLVVTFGGFFLMIVKDGSVTMATQVNLFAMFISVLMVSISTYRQKLYEAVREEKLEDANERLETLVNYDGLTGIYNMNHFYSMANRNGFVGKAFLFIDVENFKNYNERFGFEKGNELLVEVAGCISNIFAGDNVARFSDDHFAVMTDVNDNYGRIEKLIELINRDKKNIHIGVKCGAYIAVEGDTDAGIACDKARYASSLIKKRFGDNYKEYDEKVDESFKKKQYIINSIDKALSNGYIVPYYQPVVDSKSRKICGVEALARWIDPKYGMISPKDFVPVLEEHRLIHKLDNYIVQCVVKDYQKIKRLNMSVSINFSRLSFEVSDPISILESGVLDYGIERKNIHIEVTESSLSEDYELMMTSLKQLKSLGYEKSSSVSWASKTRSKE